MLHSRTNAGQRGEEASSSSSRKILPPLHTVLGHRLRRKESRHQFPDWSSISSRSQGERSVFISEEKRNTSPSVSSCASSSHSNSVVDFALNHPQPPGVEVRRDKSNRRLCYVESCNRVARRRGQCHVHGGRKECKVEGCHKCSHKGGYCVAHGGGSRCSVDGCTKSAQKGGKCFKHGGGRRCKTAGCNRAVKINGHCTRHAEKQ